MTEIEKTNETDSKSATKVEESPVDPNLIEKLANLRVMAKIGNLLTNGQFPGAAAEDVLMGHEFLRKIHAPLLKECETHPDFKRATGQKPQPADTAAIEKAEEKRNRKARRSSN